MLKEVLAQQTPIVSKLHVTETELLSLSKSEGKDSTHEETRKVVKPFGPRAELNQKANVCTMLPTTSLVDSNVNSHDSQNCSSLFYDYGGFDSLQNGKTQAQINVKDVQKASNRAKRIKYLEHQVKAAQVNVLDPKPRYSNQMKRVIAKEAVEIALSQISSQHDWGSSKIIVHGSILQNYVYPNPRSPGIDASQETEASKINLDRGRENPKANYARACLATQPTLREKHMDTSISADESELFGAPSDMDASPRIKHRLNHQFL